ncbi:cysteine hydrolase family protein [Actinomadura violacea]|uniref:Cysteine hydrolase n=1 Tax=Actinomadura violacea TaxID=2819934 RepID=A0ABS3S5H8_9ACTN|nr:cysteine hydrolase [Actinomadura violacea]MBO2464246.1 cysteine hydrolase [Actinomadura violacea]
MNANMQALLVMDVQRIVAAQLGDRADRYLARLAETVAAARAAGVPVIHVRVVHRDGHPEIGPLNKPFRGLTGTDVLTESHPESGIHPAVAPLPGEPVLDKRFFSAFAGTDLDALLKARGAGTLVLTGLATSGVVISTLRDATERQYAQIVLSDGCDDADEEMHRFLVERFFPREAEIMTSAEWVAGLPAQ